MVASDWGEALEDMAFLPSFYAGREVFITGGTGFLGKVLLERLLWTCPNVSRVHVLMRHKRGQTPLERLQLLRKAQVFDKIRVTCPSQLEKLCVVSGDIGLPRLGLDDDAIELLKHVSVVFHNAANVKFLESLQSLLEQNVYSVIELLDICDQLPKLEALVHVSTAYTNVEHARIEERVLPPSLDLHRVKAIVDALPPDLLKEITPRLISPKPNTYCFTKCLAENVLLDKRDRHYAIGISRPSIVVSSYRYPCPGWVEGLAGASGSVAGTGAGLMHITNMDSRMHADFVPVDITIDITLAIAWEIASDRAEEVRVYNISSQENPILWSKFMREATQELRTHAFENAIYYPITIAVKNKYLFEMLQLILQTAPLHIADKLASLCGVKTKTDFKTISNRLRTMNTVLAYFSTREWYFCTDNVQRLKNRLSQEDSKIYNLDISTVFWEKHTVDFVRGVRKFVLKESEQTLPQARKRMNRLRWLHRGLMFTFCALLFRLIMCVVPIIRHIPNFPALIAAAAQHKIYELYKSHKAPKWLKGLMLG